MQKKPPSSKLPSLTDKFTHVIVKMYWYMLKKLALVSLWFLITPPLVLILGLSLSHNKNSSDSFTDISASIDNLPPANGNNINGQVLSEQINDLRPYLVSKFLKNTPLESYADLIVKASDDYGIDYRLIPAIAMKESQGGLAIDQSTHNAWGFNNGKATFASWEFAIVKVAQTLKSGYIDKGLTTPEAIMAVYAPPQLLTGGKWARDINFFFSKMESL
ncbi:MAG: hypothetical protein A2868_03105 [Candidatus Levybacteria bacterium RIFCSPHIGHO2_01_FULL_40_15b]|nr:MAG: hypothetical protein A2868_03105 [Candidatus Levybacteria bacterium RIFCSPHIGHO2_01_FULL_40_15b]